MSNSLEDKLDCPESGFCCRLKATDELRRLAENLRRKANGFQQLADQIDLIEQNLYREGEKSGPHLGSEAEWELVADYGCHV